MRRLAPLILLLAAAFVVFLVRGLPQAQRLQRAVDDLHTRQRELEATRRAADVVGYDDFAALAARHERAAERVQRRWAALTEGRREPPIPTLAELLEKTTVSGLRKSSPQAERLLVEAAASPAADAALAAIVSALPAAEGLAVEDLVLREGGRVHVLPEPEGLSEVEAQLVLTGGLADVVGALERLAPERGAGFPIVSVRTASLRRIEPERWGSGLHRVSTPPVRLSATLAVLFPTEVPPR